MWEKNINWLPLAHTPTRDWTGNPNMCPDWELNQWPFGLQDDGQPTETHWPHLEFFVLILYKAHYSKKWLLIFKIHIDIHRSFYINYVVSY